MFRVTSLPSNLVLFPLYFKGWGKLYILHFIFLVASWKKKYFYIYSTIFAQIKTTCGAWTEPHHGLICLHVNFLIVAAKLSFPCLPQKVELDVWSHKWHTAQPVGRAIVYVMAKLKWTKFKFVLVLTRMSFWYSTHSIFIQAWCSFFFCFWT